MRIWNYVFVFTDNLITVQIVNIQINVFTVSLLIWSFWILLFTGALLMQGLHNIKFYFVSWVQFSTHNILVSKNGQTKTHTDVDESIMTPSKVSHDLLRMVGQPKT